MLTTDGVGEEIGALNLQSETKPTNENTIDEIKAWLTEHDIDYTGKILKADLLALVTK